jgi:hypothetical protein
MPDITSPTTAFDNFKNAVTDNINLIKSYIDSYQTTYEANKAAIAAQIGTRVAANESFQDLIDQSSQLDFENNSLKSGWKTPINDLNQFIHDSITSFNAQYLN